MAEVSPSPRPTELEIPYLAANLRISGLWVLALIASSVGLGLINASMQDAAPGSNAAHALVAAAILSLVVGGMAFLKVNRGHRGLRLRRVGSNLEGLDAGPIPLDVGRIHVTLEPPRKYTNGARDLKPRFDIVYEGPDGRLRLYFASGNPWRATGRGSHVTVVRAVAEGICRIGGYALAWTDEAGEEVREPKDLDAPLTSRLASERDTGEPTVVTPKLRVHSTADGTLVVPSVQHHQIAWFVIGVGLLLASAFAACDYTLYAFKASGGWPHGVRDLAVGVVAVAIIVAVDAFAVRRTTEVDPRGIHLRTRLFGLKLRDRAYPSEKLESLYVVPGVLGHWLMLAGDGYYDVALSVRDVEEATGARRLVVDALLGR